MLRQAARHLGARVPFARAGSQGFHSSIVIHSGAPSGTTLWGERNVRARALTSINDLLCIVLTCAESKEIELKPQVDRSRELTEKTIPTDLAGGGYSFCLLDSLTNVSHN